MTGGSGEAEPRRNLLITANYRLKKLVWPKNGPANYSNVLVEPESCIATDLAQKGERDAPTAFEIHTTSIKNFRRGGRWRGAVTVIKFKARHLHGASSGQRPKGDACQPSISNSCLRLV